MGSSIPAGAVPAGALAQWLGSRAAFAVTTAAIIIPFLRTFTSDVPADLDTRHSQETQPPDLKSNS
jgi:hypothetical protein